MGRKLSQVISRVFLSALLNASAAGVLLGNMEFSVAGNSLTFSDKHS